MGALYHSYACSTLDSGTCLPPYCRFFIHTLQAGQACSAAHAGVGPALQAAWRACSWPSAGSARSLPESGDCQQPCRPGAPHPRPAGQPSAGGDQSYAEAIQGCSCTCMQRKKRSWACAAPAQAHSISALPFWPCPSLVSPTSCRVCALHAQTQQCQAACTHTQPPSKPPKLLLYGPACRLLLYRAGRLVRGHSAVQRAAAPGSPAGQAQHGAAQAGAGHGRPGRGCRPAHLGHPAAGLRPRGPCRAGPARVVGPARQGWVQSWSRLEVWLSWRGVCVGWVGASWLCQAGCVVGHVK